MKIIATLLSLIFLSFNFVSAQTVPSADSLRTRFDNKVKQSIDHWYGQNIASYSTTHKCVPTNVAPVVYRPGEDYIVPKILRLGELLEGLAKVYPYMNQAYKQKIEITSKRIYHWLYNQIDWQAKRIKDDYGSCYKNIESSYSHLTTPHTVKGLLAFRRNLSPTDEYYQRISLIVEMLAVGHLQNVDGWMRERHSSANFMALNLSVLAALNEINPNNVYLRDSFARRFRADYSWIRSSWINDRNEQHCNLPLMYGGWSHSDPNIVAGAESVQLNCSYFLQSNTDTFASSLRSYYLQKVSYHTIITKGLLDIHKILESKGKCDLVRYGTQGTCIEIKKTILLGAAGWLYQMIEDDGRMPTAYKSYVQDEFKNFSDRAGTVPGITNLIQILHSEVQHRGTSNFSFRHGYPGEMQPILSIASMKGRVLKSLETGINITPIHMMYLLQDAGYKAHELYK